MRYLYITFFFLSISVFAVAGPSYYMEEESSVVPLHIRNKLILVEGQANGRSGYFLFDTGASELILNEAHFPRHKYHSPKKYFAGAGGYGVLQGYTYVSSFNWGCLRRDTFFAPRMALQALENILGEKLLGIIGYDVLQHVDLRLDYYRGGITLLRPGSAARGTASHPEPDYIFQFEMDRHLPVVNARAGEAEGLLLAIDSGSSVNVCARRLRRRLKSTALQKRTVSMYWAAGFIRKSACYIMESLQVENTYSIAYCRVALGNLKALEDNGFRIDGLLGVNFFRMGLVFFSYRSRRIAVWLERNDYTLRHRAVRPVERLSAE